ncbi:uncharacterized protein LOC113018014 [Astatotilapia calliptera]|uniref:uncharacterized protein LOC113018014 n=1 Tax=Astatotilapia calliptera TaxID=8154 RepID=UPI000E4198C8|nr:uncharacterized protein LOC113018014 [Astatotilapia calliptera]
MKNGTASLILRDVTADDSGAYHCIRVQLAVTRSSSNQITTIKLRVDPPAEEDKAAEADVITRTTCNIINISHDQKHPVRRKTVTDSLAIYSVVRTEDVSNGQTAMRPRRLSWITVTGEQTTTPPPTSTYPPGSTSITLPTSLFYPVIPVLSSVCVVVLLVLLVLLVRLCRHRKPEAYQDMAAEDGITESEIKISNSQVEGTQESTEDDSALVYSIVRKKPGSYGQTTISPKTTAESDVIYTSVK